MTKRIGNRVDTPYGPGEIIGVDLPGYRAERLIVMLDDCTAGGLKQVSLPRGGDYFFIVKTA